MPFFAFAVFSLIRTIIGTTHGVVSLDSRDFLNFSLYMLQLRASYFQEKRSLSGNKDA